MPRRVVDAAVSVRDLALTVLAMPFLAPAWFLPWRAACALGRFYGSVMFVVAGKARRAGVINLRRAYGHEMTLSRARRSILAVWQNLGQSVAEGVQFARRFRTPASWEDMVVTEDEALAARILADSRPRIVVTAHLGSWEITALVLQRVAGGAGIARRVDNRWLDALVKRVRLDDASQWIEKQGGASEALRRLERGESVLMLLDENGGRRGPFVEFFGRPASTRKTPAVLALRTGAPIVIAAAIRDGEANFRMKLALIDPVAEGLRAPDDIEGITQRITSTIEAWIRETPLQWRWIHWRWRTRPDGSEERYGRREVRDAFGSR